MQPPDEPSAPAAPTEQVETSTPEKRGGTPLSAVRFAVRVEFPVDQLSLAQLRSLAPGETVVPSIPFTPDDLILQVNGLRVGRGSLFTIEQRWAVRISGRSS